MRGSRTSSQARLAQQAARQQQALLKKQQAAAKKALKALRPKTRSRKQHAVKQPKKQQNHPAGAAPLAPAGLPVPNTTFDFTLTGILGAQCHLDSEFEMATQHSHGSDPSFRWTHIMYVAIGLDVRDSWPGDPANTVDIPSSAVGDSVSYLVVFVEVVNLNTPTTYKRVFLQRQTVDWPNNNL